MIRRTDPHVRRRSRFKPTIQGLEARLALSAVGAAVPRAALSAAVATAPAFPLRPARFTALFQGTYTQGPAKQPGFATRVYMAGGGNTSSFYHANIQLAVYRPDDPAQVAVGQANLIPKGQGAGGNMLLINLTGVPGRVDRAGRPNLFTWDVVPGSGGPYTTATGTGTVQLIHMPSRTPPRGAPAGGHMGVVIRGELALNGVSSTVF